MELFSVEIGPFFHRVRVDFFPASLGDRVPTQVAFVAMETPNACLVFPPSTVVPIMNGHPRDQAKVSVHCRWPLIRGNLTLKCVARDIDNVAAQGRWPITTGVAQGRYYCNRTSHRWRLAA